MGALADDIMLQSPEDLSSPTAWLGIIAYTFQIYYDFSGYSDMAIGLGNLFGFKILENFNYPYISRSIREFWKRWHISLTNWFRDYVYIPLGGNKKGKVRTYINLITIFLLTGFWHGSTWSFVFWGVFHGTFMMIERLFLGKYLDKIPAFFSWTYTLLIVMIGWVFFRIEDFDDAYNYVHKMFEFTTQGEHIYSYLNSLNLSILIMAAILSTPIYPALSNYYLKEKTIFQKTFKLVTINIILPAMFIYCVILLCGSSYNPFIYFRF
jgi:alginate O-acetyltransferase complex protein AlgI